MLAITQNLVTEWSFASKTRYDDPFNDVQLDVLFTDENGEERLVPAFWAGESIWRVRFSAPNPGVYRYRSICSNVRDADLHGLEGEFLVAPYRGANPLFRHGRLQVSENRRYLCHSDGKPFFWLGDTWWMGLCKRLTWPKGFHTLALDRVEKGFSVVLIVAGLYPDMPAFDERGANEAGFPWDTDYSSINPDYWNLADRRISHMVDLGLTPCIVGCWGYHLRLMGIEKMKAHWRNLIARYGAYPVVWCLSGEATMPYYMSETKDEDVESQKKGWTDLTAYVRETDPFHNVVTIHPTSVGRDQVEDPSLLDLNMLQTGHSDRDCLERTIKSIVAEYDRDPRMPVLNGEVCYEGIGEACRQDVQRLMFWSCVLNGACGHTYGANGIWQVNTREKPYGPSPHGMSWGNVPWEDAAQLPGSSNLGLAKGLLERYEWWRFEPHPEWAEPHWTEDNYFAPSSAGIPREVRVIYWPRPLHWGANVVKGIEEGVRYRAFLFNPSTGDEQDIGDVVPNANGDWELPLGNGPWRMMPIYQDWVLVLERTER